MHEANGLHQSRVRRVGAGIERSPQARKPDNKDVQLPDSEIQRVEESRNGKRDLVVTANGTLKLYRLKSP